ncbi:hypothetical protein GCM10027445_49610 [Amycolatopsis endophytica]|uniref:Uncharacterized protein n=1 Tax=Amycolatopsis endophytica TaxID=860233 RepID=A0A853B271_9PSEU|nr:hypothetical protein [Amycolatopsis endophytica]
MLQGVFDRRSGHEQVVFCQDVEVGLRAIIAIYSTALLRSYGRFVESLNGNYITACDVGTSVRDMDVAASESQYVTGRSRADGGAGDSSVLTALGVYRAMLACVDYRRDPRRSRASGSRFPGSARSGRCRPGCSSNRVLGSLCTTSTTTRCGGFG